MMNDCDAETHDSLRSTDRKNVSHVLNNQTTAQCKVLTTEARGRSPVEQQDVN